MHMFIDKMRTVATSHTKEYDEEDDVTAIHIRITLLHAYVILFLLSYYIYSYKDIYEQSIA
jgi:hypothetical protein